MFSVPVGIYGIAILDWQYPHLFTYSVLTRYLLTYSRGLFENVIDNPGDTEQFYEPVHEKTNNLGFRPGPTQTRLCSDSIKLEA